MSEEPTEHVSAEPTDNKILTAQYKDGQLQIVEVTPFEKGDETTSVETQILPDINLEAGGAQEAKYMQILDPEKGLVQLDLLNLTLVRCEDGEQGYRLVANGEAAGAGEVVTTEGTTVVLQSDGTSEGEENENQEAYVMVEGEQGPLVYLQSSLPQANVKQDVAPPKKSAPTPTEILEKAKALQKVRMLMAQSKPGRVRGRKRKSDLPPPHELLASPNFKLFLYSCKMCSYKCNAIKELTKHKMTEHCVDGKWRGVGGRAPAAALQCARCPFRAAVHSQLMKHVQDRHLTESSSDNEVYLNSAEAEAADVLVCGACGFESGSRPDFKKHIEEEHGATAS